MSAPATFPRKQVPDELPTTFEGTDGRYRFAVLDQTIEFTIDRLRRERHELIGELEVRCYLPGARTFDDVLSVGTFNLSSPRARSERARLLDGRANTRGEVDWDLLLEEFCQRITIADRQGRPAVVLRDVPLPDADDVHEVFGMRLPSRHPAIWFGDGDSLKSYLALQVAGTLQANGINTAFLDWELDEYEHRRRLGHLFRDMPQVRYVRCDRPLAAEVDHLLHVIRDKNIDYAIVDSVAFATHGAPESAEAAAEYFRAWRQLGIGGLHIAHVNKSETGDQKPFGSVFWHNGARATWFVKRAEQSREECVSLGLFNRKSNLGPRQPAVGFNIAFDSGRTTVERTNVSEVAELAHALPLWKRIQTALVKGPKPIHEIATLLDAKPDTVKKTLQRGDGRTFTRLTNTQDGVHRWALLERQAS